MGRKRKVQTPLELWELWEKFKNKCDSETSVTHSFSAKNSEYVSAELNKPVTYTIEGFCVFLGIARASFYAYYANNKRFADIVTRMREECEVDARRKFETGTIPTQLAGLWMNHYGYSTSNESKVDTAQVERQHNELLTAIKDAVKNDDK